jgi:putative endonuclease
VRRLLRRAPRLRSALLELAPALCLRLDPGGRGLSRGELGRLGEALAARDLRRRGWRLLARRLRTPAGEVDLLARRDGRLALVEVKTGRAPLRLRATAGRVHATPDPRHAPGRSLGPQQAARLHRAASLLARGSGSPAQVLLVEVQLLPGGPARVSPPAPVPPPGPRTYTPPP